MAAPIFRFNEQRDDLLRSVVERVTQEARDPVMLLRDAAYHEIRRLEASKPGSESLESWRRVARTLSDNPGQAKSLLEDEVTRSAKDVNGNFDRRVYALSRSVLPAGLAILLSPSVLLDRSPTDLLGGAALSERIATSGSTARIRKLTEIGTVVYVPTHLSNLDSPLFAYALESSGLPPVTYGAGKNLFTNPVLSFFMRNLGAYRVDRRLRHELYKQVLKTYSCVLIERGFHSLFFPGGTRSRSGGVERKLKLGLAGTGLEAFVRTAMRGAPRRVFFVPSTINYVLTLEAETLIDDHLRDAGKARYIIEDDESTRLDRISTFTRKLFQMEGACAVRFGEPLDPFGNTVDDEGRSYDARGREVDPRSYILDSHGAPCLDAMRDVEYTRELGEAVTRSYLRDTVVMITHVVAAAAFAELRRAMPGADLFAIVRHHDEVVVHEPEFLAAIGRVKERLVALEAKGSIVLPPSVRSATPKEILQDAERALNGYHSRPVIRTRDQGVALLDPKALLYYQNRLAAHGISWEGGTGK